MKGIALHLLRFNIRGQCARIKQSSITLPLLVMPFRPKMLQYLVVEPTGNRKNEYGRIECFELPWDYMFDAIKDVQDEEVGRLDERLQCWLSRPSTGSAYAGGPQKREEVVVPTGRKWNGRWRYSSRPGRKWCKSSDAAGPSEEIARRVSSTICSPV